MSQVESGDSLASSLLEIRNLKKHFGTTKAVDGIDFTVEEGSFFAFLSARFI